LVERRSLEHPTAFAQKDAELICLPIGYNDVQVGVTVEIEKTAAPARHSNESKGSGLKSAVSISKKRVGNSICSQRLSSRVANPVDEVR
jgi:hypothetical protein